MDDEHQRGYYAPFSSVLYLELGNNKSYYSFKLKCPNLVNGLMDHSKRSAKKKELLRDP